MSFRSYFFELEPPERAAFAERVQSTVGYMTQVAYGNKQVELGLADVMVTVAGGALAHADIPLTPRAQMQMQIRGGGASSHLQEQAA